MTRTRLLALPFCLLLSAAALSAQTPAKVDFATDVKPILQENCVECHGPLKQRAGMRLDRKSSALKFGARRIVPGSSDNSFLYHRISSTEYGPQMPPDGALKPDQIAIIKNWIDQGADWPDALANEVDPSPPNPQAVAMVAALREGDATGLLQAARTYPALLNARGPEGSTPFMYAVLYASPSTVQALLKLGADPNRKNDAGATALMWAATNLAKATLLVAAGSDVNAKSDDLRTPLMMAARKPGNAATVKLLLDHGANPNPSAKPETESSPLMEALTAGDAESTALLIGYGADAKAVGETGLTLAITNKCPSCTALLAAKITSKDVFTASLQDIAVYGDTKAVKLLLDHGADVKAFDPLGRTALMYAATSDILPLDIVKLLIAHGADVNAKDKHTNAGDAGLTVYDMAKRNGDTPVLRALVAAGAKPGPSPLGLTPVVLTARVKNDLRLAIQDSLAPLERADVNFSTNSGCISCHTNSLTAMTMGEVRQKGFAVDEKSDAAQVKANVDALEKTRDRMRQSVVVPVGDTFGDGVVAYMLLGLAAEHYPSDINTDAGAMFIADRQWPDGSWFAPTADTRPPLCIESIGQTAEDMRALQLYTPKVDAERYRTSIQKAADWIATAKSYSNSDRSWRVAGLAWAGNHKPALQLAMHELLAAQKSDGSWSEIATSESNAYATGKSLVALHLGGLPVTDPAYKRGVKWLLAHQQQDGSWYLQTRAMGFQPYFDGGFPGGHDQWISAAATNWAVQALALSVPDPKSMSASRTP